MRLSPTPAELNRIYDCSYVLQQGALALLSAIEDECVLNCDREQLVTAAGFCGWIAADSLVAAKQRDSDPDHRSVPHALQAPAYRAAFPEPLSGTVPQIGASRAYLEEAVKRLAHSTYDLCVTACARTQQLHAWTLSVSAPCGHNRCI